MRHSRGLRSWLVVPVAGLLFFTAGSREDQRGGPDPADAVAASPGCLGARTLKLDDGSQVIFAWFADRKAVIRWCGSEFHQAAQQVIRMAQPDIALRDPLSAAPQEDGPFLVVTALKHKAQREFGVGKLPFEYLSMELYKPVPGGMFIKERFGPRELAVPGMREVTIKGSP